MKNKKFISIIWGYHSQIFHFKKEQNYHMMPLDIMKQQGYECELFAIDAHVNIEDDPNFIEGVRVKYYKNIFSYLYYLFQNRGAIIYSNSLTIKTLLVGMIGRNTFFYAHSYNFGDNFIKRSIIKFFYRFFSKIRVNNSDELMQINKIKKNIGYICPLSITNDYLFCNRKNRSGAVFIGNLTAIKNPEFLIESCKILQKRDIDFQIEVIGEDRYNKNGENFQNLVTKNNLEEYIKLHGFLEPNDIKKILQKSLIQINTSYSEGQCLAVYEGALAGNILCLPNIMSFPSVFGNNALYHQTPQQLVNNIIYILQNLNVFEKSIITTQNMILDNYSYTKNKLRLENMFLSI